MATSDASWIKLLLVKSKIRPDSWQQEQNRNIGWNYDIIYRNPSCSYTEIGNLRKHKKKKKKRKKRNTPSFTFWLFWKIAESYTFDLWKIIIIFKKVTGQNFIWWRCCNLSYKYIIIPMSSKILISGLLCSPMFLLSYLLVFKTW